MVNYSPLVKYVSSRVGARMTGAVDQEDMVSWGVLGLLDAIETYDPNRPGKKAKFESYAISKIQVDPQSQANFKELRTQLIDALGELEERERLVATFYFYEGLTLKEIGKAVGLTEGRISQILKHALTKLQSRLQNSAFTAGGWQRNLG